LTTSSRDSEITTRIVRANGIDINFATAGQGPAIVLLHGWPHTWLLWQPVMQRLMDDYQVIAPDLRGIGGTTRAADGYDVVSLATDTLEMLDVLGLDQVTMVGIDLGVQIAAMIALQQPPRVERLMLMEGLLGSLPGAEAFLAKGPPWWFGLHANVDLASTVIEGHEADYLDWFLKNGTKDRQGIDSSTRDAFVEAYAGREALRCGFEHYRAFPISDQQIREHLAAAPFAMPVCTIEGGVVGKAITRQVAPFSHGLSSLSIAECAHLIPLEQPDALAGAIRDFGILART
jgi:pimeloyl-ACP methyl ester carboxylesterase